MGDDKCKGTKTSSSNFKCLQLGVGSWSSVACDVDMTGYSVLQISEYSSEKCAGNASDTRLVPALKDSCLPQARLEDGKWTTASSKVTSVEDNWVEEQYSTTMNCTGDKIEKK